VTVELKNGEIYRGRLAEVEDTMNCQLKEVTMTGRDGRVVKMENVFVRGGLVKFIVLPDLLKSAPIFKKVQSMHSKKVGETKVKAAKKK
jgi:small nuclear ribonucleoprotein D3